MGENFITLKEAASYTGYHPDYVGSLVRDGSIQGRKIGRSWVTTYAALDAYLTSRAEPRATTLSSHIRRRFGVTMIFFLITALVLIATALFLVISENLHAGDQERVSPKEELSLEGSVFEMLIDHDE